MKTRRGDFGPPSRKLRGIYDDYGALAKAGLSPLPRFIGAGAGAEQDDASGTDKYDFALRASQ